MDDQDKGPDDYTVPALLVCFIALCGYCGFAVCINLQVLLAGGG